MEQEDEGKGTKYTMEQEDQDKVLNTRWNKKMKGRY